ncbi:MAG: GNAT family N-acetyltransferase [Oscillospiraceae bacterium]|nr:GNAT family N-acetyltransferase [Oscillospiraceae bacterium]
MYLETNRLILRSYVPSDFDDYFAYIMDSELQRMLGLNGVSDRKSAQDAFQWLMDHRKFFAIIPKETQRTIGHICLHPPMERLLEDPRFSGKCGYSLSLAIAKSQRRKGYMEEALRCVFEALFDQRKADFFDYEYQASNAASHALQEKLGFRYWGKEQFDGCELNICVLCREDWVQTAPASRSDNPIPQASPTPAPFREEFFEIPGDPLSLQLRELNPGDGQALPFYWWRIVRNADGAEVGSISLRLGHNYHSYYNGNVGYEIEEPYQGHHYAFLACQMLLDAARQHGMDKLYFSCNHDNAASYKTIERLGARLLEELIPPEDYCFYFDGIKKHRIYLLEL